MSTMIRSSSSRLMKKTGSVANIGKVGSKFQFSLEFESADKLLGPQEVVITWERRGKVLSTKPVTVDRSTREASFKGEKLEQVVTLFKPRKGGISFNEKVYRLSVRANSEKGKLVGRIDINFAEYVEIPEFSKRVAAALSSGGQIIMRVQSKYLGEAKKRKNSSFGSSSVSSATVGLGVGVGPVEDAPSETEPEDDLSDLGVPGSFDDDSAPASAPVSASASRERRRPQQRPAPSPRPLAPSSSRKQRDPSPGHHRRRESIRTDAIIPIVTEMDESVKSRVRPQKVAYDEGSTRAAPSRAEFDKLKRENRALIRRNDDLVLQNEELQEQLQSGGGGASNAYQLEDLQYENEQLRKEVRELEGKLSREPVYADVVRQLKEAKMALAILSLEKDQRAARC